MVWRSDRYSKYLLRAKELESVRPLKLNEKCFVRKDHKCGKIFGASKACFIACPSETDIQPIIDLASEKLAKVGIESIVAVRERAYGQDIFCTKICGKIIEAKFCLVILDDTILNKVNIPNPNVYYEYGLMTSLNKHIIPLQKKHLKLAFNIQSHDTIKYTPANISSELDMAIKDAIKITDTTKVEVEKKGSISEKSILRNFELAGFDIKDDKWFLSGVIDDTGFKGLGQHEAGFYVYLGKVDEENEGKTYLEDLNVVLFRTAKKLEETKVELKVKNSESMIESVPAQSFSTGILQVRLKERIKLIKNLHVGFIIGPKVDKSKFIQKAKKIISGYNNIKLVSNEKDVIEIGGITVPLVPLEV